MSHAIKAACLSALAFPGSGQIYLKQIPKGIIFIVISAVALIILLPAIFGLSMDIAQKIVSGEIPAGESGISVVISQQIAIFSEPKFLIAKIAFALCWIISTVDAWLVGKRLEKQKTS